MLLRFVHPLNAWFPTLVTLAGIVILVKPLQLLNAFAPMLVTPAVSVTFVIDWYE